MVLINRPLRVSYSWDVLDDDDMIRVFTVLLPFITSRLEQQVVRFDHVIHHAALRDLLALELPLGTQVPPIVVTEMVVARDAQHLDTRSSQEVGEHALDLGLTSLEVISGDEGLVRFSEGDAARDEGVLRSAVDEGTVFEDGSDGKECGRRDFGVRLLDGLEEVLGGVVDARDDVRVTLGVGCPEDDDLVKIVSGLELADVATDMLQMSLLVISGDQVVCASFLVGGDEVRVVDRRQRLDPAHQRSNLTLNVPVQDFSATHGHVQRSSGDVPATKDEVVGMDHGQNVRDGEVEILSGSGISAEPHGRSPDERANVARSLNAAFGAPDEVVAIGKDRGGERSAIVSADTNHHEAGIVVVSIA